MGKAIVISVVGCSGIGDNNLFPRREIENAEIHTARLLLLQSQKRWAMNQAVSYQQTSQEQKAKFKRTCNKVDKSDKK